MKITHKGNLLVDGDTVRGVFVECTREELEELLEKVSVGDKVTVKRAR